MADKNPLKDLTLEQLLEKVRSELVAGAEYNVDIMKADMAKKGMDMGKSMYDNLKDGLTDLMAITPKEAIPFLLAHFLGQIADNPVGYCPFLKVEAMEGRIEDELQDFREFLQVYREVAELFGAELPGFGEMVDRCILNMRKGMEHAHSKATCYFI